MQVGAHRQSAVSARSAMEHKFRISIAEAVSRAGRNRLDAAPADRRRRFGCAAACRLGLEANKVGGSPNTRVFPCSKAAVRSRLRPERIQHYHRLIESCFHRLAQHCSAACCAGPISALLSNARASQCHGGNVRKRKDPPKRVLFTLISRLRFASFATGYFQSLPCLRRDPCAAP